MRGPDQRRTEPAAPDAGSGTFRWAVPEPTAIIPPEAGDAAGRAVVSAVFESLTRWDEDVELRARPAAALTWSTTEGGRVWTFRLREGATFHDGSPVTAHDFKVAWEHAVGVPEVSHHLDDVEGYDELREGEADELTGVRATGEHELEVRLRRPDTEFPLTVAHPTLGPVQAERFEAEPDDYRRQPVGNGPFAAGEPWVRGQFIRLGRYEPWREGGTRRRPVVSEVVFQLHDPDTAYLAFQQGRLDFTELPPGALEHARERIEERGADEQLVIDDAPTLYYLGVNTTTSPFDVAAVRRAVSMAIDRRAITEDNLEGNIRPARSAVPPAVPGWRAQACPACSHDPDAAAEILAEHDVDELVLWFDRDGGHEPIARQVRDDLDEVGVAVTFETPEADEYVDVLEVGDAGLFRFGWSLEYPSPGDVLRPLLHAEAFPPDGRNYSRYAVDEVDEALDAAASTLDPDERLRLWQVAEDLAVGRDQAIIPLFTYRQAAVGSARVSNLTVDAWGLVDLVGVAVDADDGS